MKKSILYILLSFSVLFSYAQDKAFKVVIDNDFCGDPDGLYALAHLVLTDGCDVRGIIGGHLGEDNGGFLGEGIDAAKESCRKATELLDVMGMSLDYTVVPGAPAPMKDCREPLSSEGSNLIIREAMKCSPDSPLFVLCGGSLTNIASAFLDNRDIQDNIILVWIGGPEYGSSSDIIDGTVKCEYNTGLDIQAAKTIFRISDIPLWQVPKDAYRRCIVSMSELRDLSRANALGKYLYDSVTSLQDDMVKMGSPRRDAYVLGDSPLVLLTALQTYFEPDAASSTYETHYAPSIGKEGQYDHRFEGRPIRVYELLDTRLMFADMFSRIGNFGKD